MVSCDVMVIGGGLVGGACAAALADAGFSVALVESRVPDRDVAIAGWDSRVYAIGPDSAAFLAGLGVWDSLDPQRLAPIYRMDVFGDAPGRLRGHLCFDAYQAGASHLACIVESRLLHRALWSALEQRGSVQLLAGAGCSAIDWGAQSVRVTLSDGRRCEARLVVGADGANSWVRDRAGLAATSTEYGQLGVVANFETQRPHHGTAWEWFTPDGMLAYLPLPGRRMSMVWSTWEAQASGLMALSDAALCDRVAAAGDRVLGDLILLTGPEAFPLRVAHLDQTIGHRMALIGDAAHQVHPLAGQGVNLGFRDAMTLARVLAGDPLAKGDCGAPRLLLRYERDRRPDVLAIQFLTHGLQRLFNNRNPALGLLRNVGFSVLQRHPLMKNLLVRRALGLAL